MCEWVRDFAVRSLQLLVSCSLLMPTVPASAEVVQQENPKFLQALKIPTYVWRERKVHKPKAIMLGFHGGCLHGRSYSALARDVAQQGLMFVSFDMRGYGKWYHNDLGDEDDRTFNYTRTLNDIRGLLTKLHSTYAGVPIYCIGESLGANMAMVVAYEMPELTDGIILVSPYFAARKFFEPRMMATAAQAMILPIKELDMTPYLRKRLAHDRKLAEQQIKDPMSRDKQTPKELAQSWILNWSGRRKFEKIDPRVPVLVIHGQQDGLCSPKATQKRFAELPSKNKQLVMLPDVGHLAVEASPVMPSVKRTILGWVNKQSHMLAGKTRKVM